MTMPICEINVGLLNTSSSDYHLHIQFPLPFSLHICVASSLLHLAAFGSYLLSPLLIYRPDYEQHLIAFDMIHLVCESNSPDSSCQFYFSRFLLSCLCVSGTQGSPAKTAEPITIRLGAGSCGPDEPRDGRTLAALGEIDRTIRARQRCVLTSNYFNHLFQAQSRSQLLSLHVTMSE